jgi:hypothetical protein
MLRSRFYEEEVLVNSAPSEPEYGQDFPPCATCGHAPYWHSRLYGGACQVKERRGVTQRLCSCDCYDEPEDSRRAHR